MEMKQHASCTIVHYRVCYLSQQNKSSVIHWGVVSNIHADDQNPSDVLGE